MENRMVRKGLVVGIIGLLIVVVVTPNIMANNVEESESEDTSYPAVHYMVRIQTTSETDCYTSCFPGMFRSLMNPGYRAKGIILKYSPVEMYTDKGWHLKINGEDVHEASGTIIGFFGQFDRWIYEQPPHHAPGMELDGIALMVIHGE
mgnify:CR=1 FL=1